MSHQNQSVLVGNLECGEATKMGIYRRVKSRHRRVRSISSFSFSHHILNPDMHVYKIIYLRRTAIREAKREDRETANMIDVV
jgi:hypothetical protein